MWHKSIKDRVGFAYIGDISQCRASDLPLLFADVELVLTHTLTYLRVHTHARRAATIFIKHKIYPLEISFRIRQNFLTYAAKFFPVCSKISLRMRWRLFPHTAKITQI
jgi:hypothetical protein